MPVDPRVKKVEQENRRLLRRLQKAEAIIDFQKNHHALADHLLDQKLSLGLSSAARVEWPSAYW